MDVCSSIQQTQSRVRLLYLTAIVFALIAILIHQNFTSKKLWFIQPRNNLCIIWPYIPVGCFDVLFSLYFTLYFTLQKQSQND